MEKLYLNNTLYRFRAIILNINKIRDNNTRIVFISSEYGKITGWWNKKDITGIDIWDIVEILLTRENSKNIIKNIELKIPGWDKSWNYNRIYSFLETLHLIWKITIDETDAPKIYADLSYLITHGTNLELDMWKYSLFQMRILKNLWSMNPEMCMDDPILQYIYENISSASIEKIMTSSNIRESQIEKIKKINLHSIYLLNQ